MTRNNNAGLEESCNWNEYNPKHLTRINWRASLVPAAAVIPAPIAYINAAAVETLVVGLWGGCCDRPPGCTTLSILMPLAPPLASVGDPG